MVGTQEKGERERGRATKWKRASGLSWALLTPCKALFRNNETSLESNISECHILAVSMVFSISCLAVTGWLLEMKADARVGWAVCEESRIKRAPERRKHEPINLCCWTQARLCFCLLNLTFFFFFCLFALYAEVSKSACTGWAHPANFPTITAYLKV